MKELARPNEPPSRIVRPRDGNYLHGLRTIESRGAEAPSCRGTEGASAAAWRAALKEGLLGGTNGQNVLYSVRCWIGIEQAEILVSVSRSGVGVPYAKSIAEG